MIFNLSWANAAINDQWSRGRDCGSELIDKFVEVKMINEEEEKAIRLDAAQEDLDDCKP